MKTQDIGNAGFKPPETTICSTKSIRYEFTDRNYLVEIVKHQSYKTTLERLTALRNYAAHDSDQSKARALRAVEQLRMPTAGAWLKKQGRLHAIADDLDRLADRIFSQAPF